MKADTVFGVMPHHIPVPHEVVDSAILSVKTQEIWCWAGFWFFLILFVINIVILNIGFTEKKIRLPFVK